MKAIKQGIKTNQMNTIIVSTDFSKEAENALEYAGAFARLFKARIVIFNSFRIPVHAANSLLPASAFQELIDLNNKVLHERCLAMHESYGIEALFESSLTEVEENLAELMVKYEATLIVMGMGAKSLEQDLFGNTTTAVIMKLKYPVLAVPYTSKFNGIKKILFACGIMKNYRVLTKINELADKVGAEIEILQIHKHLDRLPEDHIEQTETIDEALNGITHHYKYIESNHVIQSIEDEVLKNDPDILIMIPQKYGFLKSLLHRSKTRVMASNNNVPLLSIPMPD